MPSRDGTLCPLPLSVNGLCDYSAQRNVAEVTLCQFPGPGPDNTVVLPSCLLGGTVALKEAASAVTTVLWGSPRWPCAEAMEERGVWPVPSWCSQPRHHTCEWRSLQTTPLAAAIWGMPARTPQPSPSIPRSWDRMKYCFKLLCLGVVCYRATANWSNCYVWLHLSITFIEDHWGLWAREDITAFDGKCPDDTL